MDLLLAGAHDHGMSIYHDASRRWQDRFDTRRLADRIEERIVHDTIDDDDRAFIEARDMFFLATADEDGFPTCSYKGGDPGFVRVLDERTIAFPVYDGNGMFLSLGNLRRTRASACSSSTSRARSGCGSNGVASVDDGRPAARRATSAHRRSCASRRCASIPNCPRYIHKLQLVERSRFTPRADCEPPVPDWKRRDWARDVLAAGDPRERES